MSRRVKTPAITVAVPQSRDQVIEAIAEIGRRQRECQHISALMNEAIAAVKLNAEALAKPHGDQIAQLKTGIQIWCEANRHALTDGGRTKTAKFASGEVRWRRSPPKVGLRGIDAIIAALKAAALNRFLRTKEEIDKEAILKEPEAVADIAGITVSQADEFVIVPLETQLEEVS